MRRRGFSLAEMAFTVAIGATMAGVVAGAAQYVDNKAKVNAMTAKATEIATAIDAYMAASRGIDYPLRTNWNNASGGGGTSLETEIKPYLASGSDLYRNPYANADWHVNYHYLFDSGTEYFLFNFTAAPPWTSSAYRGIYYHRRGPGQNAYPVFKAWTGPGSTDYKLYKYWTLMVTDEKGYPKAVWGR